MARLLSLLRAPLMLRRGIALSLCRVSGQAATATDDVDYLSYPRARTLLLTFCWCTAVVQQKHTDLLTLPGVGQDEES